MTTALLPRGRLLPGCLSILLLAGSGFVNPARAAQDDPVTVAELRRELERRDAVIIRLLERVQALEEGRIAPPTDGPAEQDGPPALASAGADETRVAPGSNADIDALRAARALERGLVQEGALLLNPGQVEVAPALRYARLEDSFPTRVVQGEETFTGRVEQSVDSTEWLTNVRIGLPFEAQLEFGLPYRSVEQRFDVSVDGAVLSSTEQSGSGPGDITVGLAKVLTAQHSWLPQLTARLVWLSGSGDDRDGGVLLGGDLSGLGARLDAYWRRDPVVFLVAGGYFHYDDNGLQGRPGDRYNLSLGTGLAISPESALILSLDQGVAQEYEQYGVARPGSDRLTSVLGLSASTLLGQRLALRLNTGVGLTNDSPDYQFGLAISSRFDLR